MSGIDLTDADPLSLIDGDPAGVQVIADDYSARAETFADAYAAIGRLSLDSFWTGSAARAAQDDVDRLRVLVRKASSAFEAAGAALSDYAATLSWAQDEAGRAVAVWELGATTCSCEPATGAGRVAAAQDEARAILTSARKAVADSASSAGQALNVAATDVPRPSGFWNDLGYYTSQFARGACFDGFDDLGEAVHAAVSDPRGYLTGVGDVLGHPGELADAVLDKDTWRESPARALGHLATDTATFAATAGSVVVARRAAKIAAEAAAKEAAEAAARAAAEAAEKAAAEAARKLAEQTVADTAGGASRTLTASEQRAIASLQRLVAVHTAKLEAYRANPDAFDNLGYLERAPSLEVRQRIIDSRITHLQTEIRGFQAQIDKLHGGG